VRVGWGAGYWGVVAAGVGFLAGVAVTGMKKPGVWGTNLTADAERLAKEFEAKIQAEFGNKSGK